MSASMRNFVQFGRKLIHSQKRFFIIEQRRCINDRNIIDSTPSYFPNEEAKRSLQAEYPEVEILYDEFKYVERLIPAKTVPPPPETDGEQTPSGWIAPNPSIQPAEYVVRRTRNHMLPCYYRKHFNGRQTIKITHIYGDMWKMKEDVSQFLEDHGEKVDIQVHEVGRFMRFRGNYHDLVAKFLLSKGF